MGTDEIILKSVVARRVGITGHCVFCGPTNESGWANEDDTSRICDPCTSKLSISKLPPEPPHVKLAKVKDLFAPRVKGAKLCTKCGKSKPLSDFGIMKQGPDGYNYKCKECIHEYQNSRRRSKHSGLNVKDRNITTKERGLVIPDGSAGVQNKFKCEDCGNIFPVSDMREYEPEPGTKRKICKECYSIRFASEPGGNPE